MHDIYQRMKTENRFFCHLQFQSFQTRENRERLYAAGTPVPIRGFIVLPDETIVSAEPIGSVLTGPRKIDEKLLKFDQ